MANSKSWKVHERRVAARLGIKRNANNGQRQVDLGDASYPYAVEVKKRLALPALLREAWAQAVAGVRGEQQPLVILTISPGRGRKAADYVLLSLDAFVELREAVEMGAPLGYDVELRESICTNECGRIADMQPPLDEAAIAAYDEAQREECDRIGHGVACGHNEAAS